MQERNTLKKSLSASGLGEEEMLASVKNAVGTKPRRIRISRLGLIAAQDLPLFRYSESILTAG